MNQRNSFTIGFMALWCFLGLVNGDLASKNCEKEFAFSVDPYDSRHFYCCFGGQKRGLYCKVDEEFSILDSTCVKYTTTKHIGRNPLELVGSCEKHNVYTVDPTDSKHAYYCLKGKLIEFYCKEDEKFSVSDSTCIKNITEKRISKNPLQIIGTCSKAGYSVDAKDRRLFYNCWNGELREFYCKEGEEFSFADSTCVTYTTEKHIRKLPFDVVGNCEKNYVYSLNPSNLRHFYYCLNKKIYEFYCDNGDVFSIPEEKCVRGPREAIVSCKTDGVYTVDTSDSSHYYVCAHGKKFDYYCKGGRTFSMSKLMCV